MLAFLGASWRSWADFGLKLGPQNGPKSCQKMFRNVVQNWDNFWGSFWDVFLGGWRTSVPLKWRLVRYFGWEGP